MKVARSWLFVPGNQPRMIQKAKLISADVVVYDLEDSVPAAEKSTARESVAAALAEPNQRSLLFVRASGCDPAALSSDLEKCAVEGLQGVILPKVQGAAETQAAANVMAEYERERGWPVGQLSLVATLETAEGIVRAPEVADSSERLAGLMFGGEDLKRDLGIVGFAQSMTDDMLYARSAVALAAASRRLKAIDRVVPDFRDQELLLRDCQQGKQLGFHGKALIHPAQVELSNTCFRPTAADLEKARRIVETFGAGHQRGVGAVSVDGQMVDEPVALTAQQIIDYAAEIDRLEAKTNAC